MCGVACKRCFSRIMAGCLFVYLPESVYTPKIRHDEYIKCILLLDSRLWKRLPGSDLLPQGRKNVTSGFMFSTDVNIILFVIFNRQLEQSINKKRKNEIITEELSMRL